MKRVPIAEFKAHCSQYIDEVAGEDIVITKHGKPVARVVPIQEDVSRRIGLAKGEFAVPDDIDAHNVEVAALFLGGR